MTYTDGDNAYVTCSKCYDAGKAEQEQVEISICIDGAMTERDGDHLTFYHAGECDVCGEGISVVEYGKMHSLEVSE